MMTGVNELRLNEKTLLKAVNYWLEHEVFKGKYDRATDTIAHRIEAVEIIHLIDGQDGPAYRVTLANITEEDIDLASSILKQNNALPRGGAV